MIFHRVGLAKKMERYGLMRFRDVPVASICNVNQSLEIVKNYRQLKALKNRP
jgi:hypothetical protein